MSKDYYWLNAKSRKFLESGYLKEGQTPEERIEEIANYAQSLLQYNPSFKEDFLKGMKEGWFSLSSPIWANFGAGRALPISCNGSAINDTMDSILEKVAEVGILTKNGAGTAAYFGNIRPRGSKISTGGTSSGSVHFMELFNSVIEVISQSNVRRGSFAAYLPIDHGDIEEFLEIREEGHPIQNISLAVCVPDYWLKEMIEGDKDKRKIWLRIIKKRFESGYPYLFFTDNVNRQKPQVYKDKNLHILHSQLCNEIYLYSSPSETFVCDLSSLNLLHYDEWKDTNAIQTLVYLLDSVMTDYINKTENMLFMGAANRFAKNQRALGVGVLGWHSLLQSKMVPFESMEAKYLNVEIWKLIKNRTEEASKELAQKYGEPELLKGYGVRNTTLCAVAPTTSSSFILSQISPSIEPLNSNYFIKDLAKGKFTFKNPHLKEVLKSHDKDDGETWESILVKGGSVQHLNFLTRQEKEVFKTFGEISQKEIIIQAAQRQKYIDQGQSLNLMIHPKTSIKQVNELILFAWEQGLKGLYYQRGTSPTQDLNRSILECKSCEA